MKKIIALVLLAFAVLFVSASSVQAVYVNGYYRSNGTYVNGYERSSPNSSPYDNYGYPGNYNPNTGKITGGSASSYLNNYYKSSSSLGTGYSTPTYTAPTTPNCPLNSYYNGSSCTCNTGYVVSGGQCKSASLVCIDQIGLMSQYNSSTKTCECMAGYAYDGLSCKYKSLYTSSTSPTNYVSPNSTSSKTKKVTVPAHASASLSGTDWYCDNGYKTTYNSNIVKTGCEKIIVPSNAKLSSLGNDWYCDSGYKTKFDNLYNKIGCDKIVIPKHASLNTIGSDWVCNKGYKNTYNSAYTKIACEKN